jgi:hypothetical protein
MRGVPVQITGGRIPCRRRAARFLRLLVSILKHRKVSL